MRQHVIEIFTYRELSEPSKSKAIDKFIDMALRNYEYIYYEGGKASMGWGRSDDLLPEIEFVFDRFYEYLIHKPHGNPLTWILSWTVTDPYDISVFRNLMLEDAYNAIIERCKKYEYTSDGKIYFE